MRRVSLRRDDDARSRKAWAIAVTACCMCDSMRSYLSKQLLKKVEDRLKLDHPYPDEKEIVRHRQRSRANRSMIV